MPHSTHSFSRSLESLTRFGQIAFTPRQLYYEVCRTRKPVPGLKASQVPAALAWGALPAFLFRRRLRWAAALLLADALVVQALRTWRDWPFTLTPPLTYAAFSTILVAHQAQTGPIPGLLCEPEDRSPMISNEPDLHDYGLPRLLICQRAEIAAMLVANFIHLELSCPILALPAASPLPESLITMLQRVPAAQVYYLHDASLAGLAALPSLRAQFGLPANLPLMALGLRPMQALRLHLFAVDQTSVSQPVPAECTELPFLRPIERKWLQQGWQVEIEAVHPVRLMRTLRYVMLGAANDAQRRFSWQREKLAGFMSWPY